MPDAVRYPGSELPLGVVWAAIARCDAYLGHDTGLMHMAAAARVPVVTVLGVPSGSSPGTRGDPSHTGPYDTPSRIVRPPAARAAAPAPDIAWISPETIVQAALDLV